MRYVKNGEKILIYRNKRKPIRMVKEEFKNEDGCIACCLFDVCLEWTGRTSCTCEVMERAGVIKEYMSGDRFFVDAYED
jgi:hypothetical protein